jgi:hypothetical protein
MYRKSWPEQHPVLTGIGILFGCLHEGGVVAGGCHPRCNRRSWGTRLGWASTTDALKGSSGGKRFYRMPTTSTACGCQVTPGAFTGNTRQHPEGLANVGPSSCRSGGPTRQRSFRLLAAWVLSVARHSGSRIENNGSPKCAASGSGASRRRSFVAGDVAVIQNSCSSGTVPRSANHRPCNRRAIASPDPCRKLSLRGDPPAEQVIGYALCSAALLAMLTLVSS